MTYHIIIQQERRTAQETPLGLDISRLAIDSNGQLHVCSDASLPDHDWSDSQFVMVAEWDGRAPYVILHKGDYGAVTMRFFGWPEITEQEWINAQNPADEYL